MAELLGVDPLSPSAIGTTLTKQFEMNGMTGRVDKIHHAGFMYVSDYGGVGQKLRPKCERMKMSLCCSILQLTSMALKPIEISLNST